MASKGCVVKMSPLGTQGSVPPGDFWEARKSKAPGSCPTSGGEGAGTFTHQLSSVLG